MTQEKKLVWIHRLSPIAYDLALGGLCLYIWFRGRQWLNLLLPLDMGVLLALVLAGYYLLNLMTIQRKDNRKSVTYVTSIGTFLVMYLSMTIAASDLVRGIMGLCGAGERATYVTSIGTFLVMYLSMTIAASDLVRGIMGLCGAGERARGMAFFFGGCGCLVLTAAAVAVGMVHARKLVTVNYQVPVEHLGKEARRGMAFFFGGCGCLVLTAAAVAVGMVHARKLVTVNYQVPVEHLGKEARLVLLSDLHIGHFVGKKHIQNLVAQVNRLKPDLVLISGDLIIGHFVGKKHIQNLVAQVNRLKPDLVLISGDLINAGNTNECPDIDQVARELEGLRTEHGVFAVTGNHDPAPEDPDFRRFLRRARIHLLEDKTCDAVTGNHDPAPEDPDFRRFLRRARIHLLEDKTCDAGPVQLVGRKSKIRPRAALTELMESCTGEKPVVVLDHDPIGIQEARQAGADCVLCGHTHRGQVFPLDLLVRLLYPKEELWGMGRKGKTTSIVSAGAGYFSMPMRLGSDSEIVCIDLISQDET